MVKHSSVGPITTTLLVAAALVACGGPSKTPSQSTTHIIVNRPTESLLNIPQNPPVELGKRPPDATITSHNMPYFATDTYCQLTTRKIDKMPRGPAYETCVDDQTHYRSVIGQTIDAGKFRNHDIIHCAKASRTAYQGEWYCLNGQLF